MHKSVKYVLGGSIGGLVLLLLFQNCSRTSFEQQDLASNSGISGPVPVSLAGSPDPMLPSLVEDEGAGFSKLLIFVGGNANEQVGARQRLVSKIDKMVENLRGRDIEILVTSLTIPNNSNAPLRSLSGRADGGEIIRLNENLPLKVLLDQNSINDSSDVFARFKPYFGKDIVTISQHVPHDRVGLSNHFKISRDQWEKDYSAIKSKLMNLIMKTSDASSVDGSQSYLCKIAQYLADPRAEAIVKPTDKVGIVVLSDRDDESTGTYYGPENCPLVSKSVNSIYPEFTWYIGQFEGVTGSPYNLLLKESEYLPDSSEGVVDSYGNVSCVSSNLPDADLCHSGFYCGKEYYSNILDYAAKKLGDKYKPDVCKKTYEEGFHRMEMSGLPRRLWDGKKPYMGKYIPMNNVDVQYTWAFSEADIKAGGIALGFSNFAKKKFGENIHFTMIVNPADGACAANGSQKIAKRYSAVAQQMGKQGQLLRICEF